MRPGTGAIVGILTSPRPGQRKHRQLRLFLATARALHSLADLRERLGSVRLRDVETVQRSRIAAAAALDPEGALEAGQIGRGSNMLRRHCGAVGR